MKMRSVYMKAIVSLILAAGVCTFLSCEKPYEDEVSLDSSYGFPRLYESEFDISFVDDGTWGKKNISFFVTSMDGALAVLPNHEHLVSKAPYVQQCNELIFENISGNDRGVFIEDELVIENKCVSLLPSYNHNRLLAFCANGVYCLEKSEDVWLLSDECIPINGISMVYFSWPNMSYDAPESVYIINETGVVVMRTDEFLNRKAHFTDLSFSQIPGPDWFPYVRVTSAILIDDILYIGDKNGVVSVDLKNETYKYYQIEEVYNGY